jgi:hypothetical protein
VTILLQQNGKNNTRSYVKGKAILVTGRGGP